MFLSSMLAKTIGVARGERLGKFMLARFLRVSTHNVPCLKQIYICKRAHKNEGNGGAFLEMDEASCELFWLAVLAFCIMAVGKGRRIANQ